MSNYPNTFSPAQSAWIAALKSGEHKQIRDNLCTSEGLCCLGVATLALFPKHAALSNNGWESEDYIDADLDRPLEEYGTDECTAPPEVVDALSLQNSEGRLRFNENHRGVRDLASLNDKVGLTFAEIAEFIEAKPWLIFSNFQLPHVEADASK